VIKTHFFTILLNYKDSINKTILLHASALFKELVKTFLSIDDKRKIKEDGQGFFRQKDDIYMSSKSISIFSGMASSSVPQFISTCFLRAEHSSH